MEEYKRVFEYFDLSPEEKASRLGEVCADSVALFKRFQDVIKSGDKEEQHKMRSLVQQLQEKIEGEVKALCETTGLSPEELTQMASDSSIYTEEQWDTIQKSKSEIEEQGKILSDLVKKESGVAPKSASGSKKPKKKKAKWVRS